MDPSSPENNQPSSEPQSLPPPPPPISPSQQNPYIDKEEKSKKTPLIIGVIFAAVVLVIAIVFGFITIAKNNFDKNKAAFEKKQTASLDLVERKVSKDGNTASIMVPSKWREGNINKESFKQYMPEGAEPGEKLLEMQIVDSDVKLDSNLSDEALKQAKLDATAKEEEVYGRLSKDCTFERSDYPNLNRQYYGSVYKEECTTGSTSTQIVFVIIHNLNGAQTEFTLQNSDPEPLNQATVDNIVKSFKFK